MKGILKKVFTLFLTILTVITITACGKNNKKNNLIPNPKIETVEYDDDIDMNMFDGLDMKNIEIDNPDYYCSTYKDVEPNFAVNLCASSIYLGAEVVSESIRLTNEYDYSIGFDVVEVNDSEKQIYTITAQGGFKRGSAYSLSIEKNLNLFFEDRDPSIRKILFTVKDEDKNDMTIKDNYPVYNSKKITHFEGFGDYNTYMIYRGEFNESKDAIVMFKNPDDANDETIYIKVVSVEKMKNGVYKIYYTSPKATDIFDKLDLHVDDKDVNMAECLVLKTKKEIIESIKNTSLAQELIARAAYMYNFHEELMEDDYDFWSHCYINIAINTSGGGLTVAITFTYTHTFKSGTRLMITVGFRTSRTISVSGSAKLETFLGIPTGVALNASAEEDSSIAIEFRAVVANPKFNPEWMEATPENYSIDDAKKAVQALKNKWFDKGSGDDGTRDSVEGDTLLLDIGYISFKIAGWLSFDFDLYIGIKNQANITLGLGYTYSCHEVIVSYSTTNGDGDGGASPKKIGEHSIAGSFCGKYSSEFFLRLRLSVYITGLKWLFCFYADADLGMYFDIAGLVEFNFDLITGGGDVSGSFSLEGGLFVRVTLNILLIGGIHPNWTLVDERLPLIRFACDNNLRERSDDDRKVIELTSYATRANQTQMFTYRVFDPGTLNVLAKNYEYDTEVVWFEMFKQPIGKYKMFENFVTSDSRVKFKDGVIIIDPSVAELQARISYDYNDITGKKYSDYVDIHFLSADARTVAYDGEQIEGYKSYLPGDVIKFPRVPYISGKVFKGFVLDGVLYHSDDIFIMPDNDINFALKYVDNISYTVKYYDGNNQLVGVEKVLKGEDAIGLDPSVRDRMMGPEYTFVCYDQPLTNILGNLEVHAIYTRAGDR